MTPYDTDPYPGWDEDLVEIDGVWFRPEELVPPEPWGDEE